MSCSLELLPKFGNDKLFMIIGQLIVQILNFSIIALPIILVTIFVRKPKQKLGFYVTYSILTLIAMWVMYYFSIALEFADGMGP